MTKIFISGIILMIVGTAMVFEVISKGVVESIYSKLSGIISVIFGIIAIPGLIKISKLDRALMTIYPMIWLIAGIIFIIAGIKAQQIADDKPPEIDIKKPQAYTRYIAVDRDVVIHILAIISDDKSLRSVKVTLWGTTKTGTFEQTETLYSIEFDRPSTKTLVVNELVVAGIGSILVLPGWYYVRFVAEDFIGNRRVVWIKIYIDTSEAYASPIISPSYMVYSQYGLGLAVGVTPCLTWFGWYG